MLASFIAFIFNMVTTFVGCLLILRTYIFYQRLSIFDPVARLVRYQLAGNTGFASGQTGKTLGVGLGCIGFCDGCRCGGCHPPGHWLTA